MNEERPIEKLLRRYAKKRRDEGSAPELHPATRRLLQGEVARQFPKKEAAGGSVSFAQILKSWLPWLGGMAAVMVIVAVGGMMIFGGKKNQFAMAPTGATKSESVEMAKNEVADTSKRTAPTESSALQPQRPSPATPPAAPQVVLPEGSVETRADSTVREESKKADAIGGFGQPTPRTRVAGADARTQPLESDGAGLPAPQPPPGAAAFRSPFVSKDKASNVPSAPSPQNKAGSAAELSRVAPPAVAPTAGADQYDVKEQVSRGGGDVGQKSYRDARSFAEAQNTQTYANTTPAAPVLQNFQVVQTGAAVRVIDGDGSIYSGMIEGADGSTMKKSSASSQRVAPGAATLQSAPAQNYYYRVAGTNRTLQQQVVFSWNFVGETNQPGALQAKGAAGQVQYFDAEKAAQSSNSLINGKLRLGAGQEMEFNAAPLNSRYMRITPAAPTKARN